VVTESKLIKKKINVNAEQPKIWMKNSNEESVNLKSWFETCTGLLTCSQNKSNNTLFN